MNIVNLFAYHLIDIYCTYKRCCGTDLAHAMCCFFYGVKTGLYFGSLDDYVSSFDFIFNEFMNIYVYDND